MMAATWVAIVIGVGALIFGKTSGPSLDKEYHTEGECRAAVETVQEWYRAYAVPIDRTKTGLAAWGPYVSLPRGTNIHAPQYEGWLGTSTVDGYCVSPRCELWVSLGSDHQVYREKTIGSRFEWRPDWRKYDDLVLYEGGSWADPGWYPWPPMSYPEGRPSLQQMARDIGKLKDRCVAPMA